MASIHDMTREILDRLVRTETRLTKYMEAQGFDTKVQRPRWDKHASTFAVFIPSEAVSLKEILAVIPDKYRGQQVEIYLEGQSRAGPIVVIVVE